MPYQAYFTNVAYSTLYTGYFYVLDETVQGAAIKAVTYHDSNNQVVLANGTIQYGGNIINGQIGSYAKFGVGGVSVYVRDPSANQTWLITITSAAANVFTVATYNIASANSNLVTNG